MTDLNAPPSPPGTALRMGANCVVHPDASVDGTALLGHHVVIEEGATIAQAATIGSGTYVGARVRVGASARIGANATLLPDVAIAAQAEIRPGSVVGRSVPPMAIVEGNPAVITGYVGVPVGARNSVLARAPATGPTEATNVRGVTVHNFPVVVDLRGNLTAAEFEQHIPFRPLRYFMVFDVPSRETRGEHAHRECHQFLVCVRGTCAVVADDGASRIEVALDVANRGLYLPPMTWGIQYKYSADALLLVFASHHYDPADYIRDYDQFLELSGRRK